MLVTELRAKVIKRGLYYNKWLPVIRFSGSKITLQWWDEINGTNHIEFKLTDIGGIDL